MMVEAVIRSYLAERLSVPVYLEEPATKPAEYVVIEKTGSSESNHIYRATLALQSYGTTMARASALNEEVKDAMDMAITLPEISASRLNSDYNFTDTTTQKYRYQAVYDLVHF